MKATFKIAVAIAVVFTIAKATTVDEIETRKPVRAPVAAAQMTRGK